MKLNRADSNLIYSNRIQGLHRRTNSQLQVSLLTNKNLPTNKLNFHKTGRITKRHKFPMTPTQLINYKGQTLTEHQNQQLQQTPLVYYFPESRRQGSFTNSEGELQFQINDHIAFRFQILSVLGKGSFGQVLKVLDHKTSRFFALKVMHSSRELIAQGANQIKLLTTMKKSKYTVKIHQYLKHQKHLCILLQLLSYDLYTVLKFNNFKGLSILLLKKLGWQILRGLQELHANNIIHCDLKPENVAFRSESHSEIKIIDLGTACQANRQIFKYFQSRYYRAPEVVLGQKYSFSIDIWSFGCVISECYFGKPLFPANNQEELLDMIIETRGPKPGFFERRQIGDQSPRRNRGNLREKFLGASELFVDLVQSKVYVGCLNWDPEQRLTAEEALKHPWFRKNSQ